MAEKKYRVLVLENEKEDSIQAMSEEKFLISAVRPDKAKTIPFIEEKQLAFPDKFTPVFLINMIVQLFGRNEAIQPSMNPQLIQISHPCLSSRTLGSNQIQFRNFK